MTTTVSAPGEAGSLVSGAGGPVVGVLSPFVRGNYYGEVLSGIADATSAAGGTVIAVQTMEAGSFSAEFIGTSGFRPAVAWDHVAGFVVVANAVDPRYLHALRGARKPVVMVSHEYPDFPCPVVLPANAGIRAAVAHLIAHGHRRIAFVGFVSVSDIRERFQAYVETLRDHGIEPDATLVFATANNAADGGDGAARNMIAAGLPSTAVVAATDLNAIGVMRTLTAAGYTLPRDQAVVGFDDIAAAGQVVPRLSSVHQDIATIGHTAAGLLLRLLAGHQVPAGRVYVPAPFVIRDSCGCSERTLPESAGPDERPSAPPAHERLVASLASLLTPDSTRAEQVTAFRDGVEAIVRVVDAARSGTASAAPARRELREFYHLDVRPEHLPGITRAVRAYGEDVAAGDGPTLVRVMECVQELTLALADVAAHAQFDDMQEYQAMLGTQYAVSMGLLRSHEEDPRDLQWLAHTRASAGCLGLWTEPMASATALGGVGPVTAGTLEIAGVFAREQRQPAAGAPSVTAAAFPPRELLTHARETPGDVIFVVPVRIPSSDWGLLAVVARTETRVPAGQEILSQSAALLAVALEHEAVVMSLRVQEEQLRRSAVYDGLTGLPNRTLFMDRLTLAIARAKPPSADRFAVLFLDLDGFKAVNDSLGHDVGDQLLVQVAERLAAHVREVDVVARFGGDEFLVLIDGAPDLVFATAAAERLQAALARPYVLAGDEVIITASVGIAMSDPRYETAERLLRDADMAMYSAKSHHRGSHAAFDMAMHGKIAARLQVEVDLRRAVERGELEVHYQSVVDLETSSLRGFEAFVRWNHPARGLLRPDVFLPVAEECGLILQIGRWVLHEACQQLRSWQLAGVVSEAVSVSVNISGRQFWHDDLLDMVTSCLRETGLSGRNLALELTESILMSDVKRACAMLEELRCLGVMLQIDDFGTGYSSLEALYDFPLDALKLDRSFVARLDDPRSAGLVQAMVAMGRNLGLAVGAVGVETAGQRAQLRRMGCSYAQGYFFSRPVPAAAVTRRSLTCARTPDKRPLGGQSPPMHPLPTGC